jgi:hypothetical protein
MCTVRDVRDSGNGSCSVKPTASNEALQLV